MPDKTENKVLSPFMGVIMLDTSFPRIKGDIGNPASFGFPVHYKVVKEASPERIVLRADKTLIRPFIAAGRSLIRDGAIAIATSCGFLALFHQELTLALDVPVFSSSLLQVHLAQTLLKPGQKVGVITARKPSLTQEHLAAVGIQNIPMVIQGMEEATEFTNVFIKGKSTLNESLCRKEMKTVAQNLVTRHPDVGPIVLECTNMPPYTGVIQQVAGQPVFDITTLLNMAWAALNPIIR